MRRVLAAWLMCSFYGCGIIGPSCVDARQTGPVFSLNGEVAAGGLVVHQVPYGTDGSQNDGTFRWVGDTDPAGPRPRLFVTGMDCTDFDARVSTEVGQCRVIAEAGWVPGTNVFIDGYILTHGRGNPPTLGSQAQYKIWILGDPQQPARYTVSATWFFGPDC